VGALKAAGVRLYGVVVVVVGYSGGVHNPPQVCGPGPGVR
jgi:hypothetical protein